jgi:hypothetical protein
MWTAQQRAIDRRDEERYPSNLTEKPEQKHELLDETHPN